MIKKKHKTTPQYHPGPSVRPVKARNGLVISQAGCTGAGHALVCNSLRSRRPAAPTGRSAAFLRFRRSTGKDATRLFPCAAS
ncbi:hypothetical protein SLA2020_495460 [Shorea laevis]